jgi:hypothetical protein
MSNNIYLNSLKLLKATFVSARERSGMKTVKNVILSCLVLMPLLTLLNCNKGKDDVDLNPPEIVTCTPANEAGGVALNSEITITFNKSVSGVSHSSISLVEVNSYGAVDSDITYDAATHTATLKPKNNLRYDFLYVVTVNSQVRSAAGVSFKSASWVFTTGYEADSIKPTVLSTTPATNQEFISVGSTIQATFSEDVKNVCDSSTGVSTTFLLKKKGTSVYLPATVVYNPTGFVATLTPTVPLDDWTEYEVELTSGITDMAGNTLESSAMTSFYFMTEDVHAPTILNATPANGDINVARNTQVIVTFSERVKSSSVKASSFYVKDVPTDTMVSALVTYDEANNRAILVPGASLNASTQYMIYLTNSISDYAGNVLSNISWTFTTGAALADTIAPTVIARVPSPNALNVDPEAALKATFSENVVGAETNFTVVKTNDGSSVAAVVIYSGTTHEATLTPKYPLEQGTQYTVQLSSNIKDSSNNALIAETWDFITADNTKPTVTGKTPGVGELTSANTVEAVFSERLDPSSVLSTTFTVFKLDGITDPQVSGSVQYFDATRTARFVPDGGFDFDTTYRVMLTNGLKDLSGNTLNAVQWDFKTRVEPDTTPPDVASRNPAENATGVSINPVILFSFTESVVSTQIGANNVKLLLGGVTPVNATVSYSSADKQVTIRPDAKLSYNTQYTVQVSGDVAGYEIKDLSGNSLVNRSWIFTTEADTTPPHVSFKIPDDKTTDIYGNAIVVEAVFSEPVTNVDISSFYLQKVGGGYDPVPLLTVEKVTGTDERYRLKLISTANPITSDGSYDVILDSSKIKDTAGNFLAAYGTWRLGVNGIDLTPPTATFKDPATTATPWRKSIDGNFRVRVQFNERVQNVDNTTFKLEKDLGSGSYSTIIADVVYTPGLQTAELTVDAGEISKMTYETTFRVTLSGTISDLAGNHLVQDQWNIRTDADSEPPTILTKSPASGQVDVPYASNSKVIVSFSEKVTGGTVSSFFVKKAADLDADRITTVSLYQTPLQNQYELTFTNPLDGNTLYEAVLTNAIKDLAVVPNALTETRWQFRTAVKPDSTPPSVQSTTPSNNATGISMTAPVVVAFSENVQNASSSYIKIRKGSASGEVMAADFNYDSDTFVATLQPTAALNGNTIYYIVIDAGIKDIAGNLLSGGQQNIQFTTVADTTGPTCTIGYKAPGNPNVSNWTDGSTIDILNPEFVISFSEPVSNVSATTITITRGGTAISKYVTYDSATNKASVQLQQQTGEVVSGVLQYLSTSYIITVTSGVADTASPSNGLNKVGAGAASNTAKTFITPGGLPKVTGVLIGGTTVRNNTIAVPVDATSIDITFDKAMNTAKLWFDLYSATDDIAGHALPVSPGVVVWSNGNKTVSIPIVGRFKASTAYNLRFYGWGGTYEDTFGNVLDRTSNFVSNNFTNGILVFTTDTDSTFPAVISSFPAEGSTAAGTGIPVVVFRFSEPMNTAVGTVTLAGSSATLINPEWMDSGRTLVYKLSGALNASTAHTVTLTSFTDINGQALSLTHAYLGNGILNFTTSSNAGSTVITAAGEDFETLGGNPNPAIYANVYSKYGNILTDSTYFDGSSTVGANWIRYGYDSATSQKQYGFFKSEKATWFTPFGNYMAFAADPVWDYNDYADIVLVSSADFSAAGSYLLSFKMAHINENNQCDRVQVLASTDGTNYTVLSNVAGSYDHILRFDNVTRSYTVTACNTTSGNSFFTTTSSVSSLRVGDYVRDLTNGRFINSSLSGGYTLITAITTGSPNTVTVSQAASATLTAGTRDLTFDRIWGEHFIDLSSYRGNNSVFLKLRAYSAGEAGNNVYVDDIKVMRY